MHEQKTEELGMDFYRWYAQKEYRNTYSDYAILAWLAICGACSIFISPAFMLGVLLGATVIAWCKV